jgi:peptide/nickel transport system ATP-binding protein/oligopeptide transport system ATP-binding protein
LAVRDLSVVYRQPHSAVQAVDSVSFTVARGEILGIVGESGSGKSTVIRAIMRLLRQPPAEVYGGEINFEGRDLLTLSPGQMRALRGAHIAQIFQDPFASLNPVVPVGKQIAEAGRYRRAGSRRALRARVLEVMNLVGIPDARRRLTMYPDELSGGLRQRVAIAAALMLSPALLLADEPTTALDVTIQDQILKLLLSLRDELGMSVILVTHDLGVVAQTCDQVIVMYAGRVVESGPVAQVLASPSHPYTKALLDAIPRGVRRDGRLQPIAGSPPDLSALPDGCSFTERCRFAGEKCRTGVPPLEEHSPGRFAACIRLAELKSEP